MNIYQKFEKVGEIFIKRFLAPCYEKFPERDTNWVEGLKYFVGCGLYGRGGSSPDYPHVAIASIDEVAKEGQDKIRDPGVVWQKFKNKLELIGQKPNTKVNPLAPENTSYQLKFKNRSKISTNKTSKKSVIELLNEKIHQYDFNIITYINKQIESGTLENIHSMLKNINGVSNKIASMLIRDIAVMYDISLTKDITQRRYLQPIDIWIKRYCFELGNINIKADWKTHAEYIVKSSVSGGAVPEKVNMGMWYFASQIAGSYHKLKNILQHDDELIKLVKSHLKIFKETYEANFETFTIGE